VGTERALPDSLVVGEVATFLSAHEVEQRNFRRLEQELGLEHGEKVLDDDVVVRRDNVITIVTTNGRAATAPPSRRETIGKTISGPPPNQATSWRNAVDARIS
jgi:hypothetical protein